MKPSSIYREPRRLNPEEIVQRPAVCAQLLARNWRLKYEAERIDLPTVVA